MLIEFGIGLNGSKDKHTHKQKYKIMWICRLWRNATDSKVQEENGTFGIIYGMSFILLHRFNLFKSRQYIYSKMVILFIRALKRSYLNQKNINELGMYYKYGIINLIIVNHSSYRFVQIFSDNTMYRISS